MISLIGLTACAPKAVISATPSEGSSPLTVTFDGSKSTGSGITTYSWDYGDGSPIETGEIVSHIYTIPKTYTAKLTVTNKKNKSSSATANITVKPISISITSPLQGETVSNPGLVVRGTISNYHGTETGVAAGGVTGTVSDGNFEINDVPVTDGSNTITVTATDSQGNTSQASVSINVDVPEEYIRLSADEDSGLSPFETTLRIIGSFNYINPTLTVSGPGQVEYLDGSTDSVRYIKLTVPGLYYFTAHVQNQEGITFSATVAVAVQDQAQVDTLLKTKWQGMRQKLSDNDIDGCAASFSNATRESFKNAFNAMTQGQRTNMAQDISDIKLIKSTGNAIEYDIQTTKDSKVYSFILLFVKDEDGLWKIRGF